MTTEMIERILSKENLEEAKCKVMSNKGSAGVDRMKTSELPKFIEAHGEELCEAIRRRKYKPLPIVHEFQCFNYRLFRFSSRAESVAVF